jgi:hypothetical protein
MGTFRAARGGGVRIRFDSAQVAVLASLLTELLTMLAEGGPGPDTDADPLAVAVGIGTTTQLPDDPVLARLFPDGYTDDPEASSDFRRYTEPSLRESKQKAARTALATLASAGGRASQRLTDEQARAWLATLNDLRLAIGTRIDVTEEWDHDLDAMTDDDPQKQAFAIYDHLSYLQETLVRALSK